MVSRLVAWTALVAASASCGHIEYEPCGDLVCPAGTLCCGDVCAPATCGDGEVQKGTAEQCDTYTFQSCTEVGKSFGQVACTAACTTDSSSCGAFGFDEDPAWSCADVVPSKLASAGLTLWGASNAPARSVRVRGGACGIATLPWLVERVIPLSEDEAIFVSEREPLGANSGQWKVVLQGPAGQVVLPTITHVSATIASVHVHDPDTVLFGLTNTVFVLRRGSGGWTGALATVRCSDNSVRKLQAMMPFGTSELVTVFEGGVVSAHDPDPDQNLSLSKALAGQGQIVPCVAVPNGPTDTPTYLRTLHTSTGSYMLLGAAGGTNGTPRLPFALEVTAPTEFRSLGLDQVTHVEPTGIATGAWLDAAGDLLVARDHGVMAYRHRRWRRLEAPSTRDFGPMTTVADQVLTTTSLGVASSRGYGYEILHDTVYQADKSPAVCNDPEVPCGVLSTGWSSLPTAPSPAVPQELVLLETPNFHHLLRSGTKFARVVRGSEWRPRRMVTRDDIDWIMATTARFTPPGTPAPPPIVEAYLFRGSAEGTLGGPSVAPAVADTCAVEGVALDASSGQAVAVLRTGDPACPKPYGSVVVTRANAVGSPSVTRWTTDRAIVAATAPRDGSSSVLVVVANRAPDGAPLGFEIVELPASGGPILRASFEGPVEVRQLWAERSDAAWLVGYGAPGQEGGVLFRFERRAEDYVVEDRSAQLPATERNPLFAISGTGERDVFVGGADGALAHFDGVAWTTVARPALLRDITYLSADADELRIAAGTRALALRIPRPPVQQLSCPAM